MNYISYYLYEKYFLKFYEIFPSFKPNISGKNKDLNFITKLSINSFYEKLNNIDKTDKSNLSFKKKITNEIKKNKNSKLKKFLDAYKSDKSKKHGYHTLYEYILKSKNNPKIFEIGVGSNNKKILGSVGSNIVPGGSIIAFKKFKPKAKIYCADIDKQIKFNDKDIKFFYLNQFSVKSFNNLNNKIKLKFDLMIDDGLHSIITNINSLIFFLKKLDSKGFCVIEDIGQEKKGIWEVVIKLLPKNFKGCLIKFKLKYMLIVQKD